ncbi:MAG TPA: 6-phosphofructokinase [Candidatus Limiplasma sp.]|nr:6-phosphofructokinase [Candidatus Limiplasma sp.]
MNVLVGQSGGPTSVINASLAGVFQAAQRRGIPHVYGMVNGIAGFLEGRTVDLSAILDNSLEIELLKRTPSSFLGSCRFKLPNAADDETVYQRIFQKLTEMDIGFFLYIGGNDSMDTILKLSDYAAAVKSPIRFMGVPKTIDNDLFETDHTPGYGSAAKYIAVVMKEIVRDATVYGNHYVTIVETMGRNAGWLTAAAALARGDDCEGVDMICLPEIPFNVEHFIEKVAKMQKKRASIVIAVSEGVKLADGRYVCLLSDDERRVDAFGHTNLTGTARYLANRVAHALPTKTRCIELSTLQRCAAHLSSRVDITEAYQVGGAAVKAAFEGHTGEMIGIRRISNDPYQYVTEAVDVHRVANLEKNVPLAWINGEHTDMLPAFLQYARPLIQAELSPIFIDGLVRHTVLDRDNADLSDNPPVKQ